MNLPSGSGNGFPQIGLKRATKQRKIKSLEVIFVS